MNFDVLREKYKQCAENNLFGFMHEHVTMLLPEQITTMAILPGEVLRESQLAEALEVSRTPIRQALTTLESMDFIQFVPGKGYIVSEIHWNSYREWSRWAFYPQKEAAAHDFG